MNCLRMVALFSLFLPLGACQQEGPKLTVLLLDTSKSITSKGITDEFHAADMIVDGMRRGDRFVIVPITGDALTDTPGRVLHFDTHLVREPYDHDLVVFRLQAHQNIGGMRGEVIARPAVRTDIFGALNIARQKIEEGSPEGRLARLVIMSDFLEDDGKWRFVSDKELGTAASARLFGQQLSNAQKPWQESVDASAFLVESTDLRRADKGRQEAVIAFWTTYLSDLLRRPVSVRVI